jgi:polysaccharide biosynthesis/export protein
MLPPQSAKVLRSGVTSRSSKIRGRHLLLVLNTLIVFLSYQGIAASQEPNVQRDPLDDQVIGQGDLLQIRLYGVADFNVHVRVDSGGEISLPHIGAVKVLGLTIRQVRDLVEQELKEKGFYDHPQATVLQLELGSQHISVLGEVIKPGVYPILGPSKLFDMISVAGGFTPKAGQEILISHRSSPGKVQKLSLSSVVDKRMEANVDVFPGDMIVVTKGPMVYVVGDVKLPGGFSIDESKGLTVLQALALAQGANSTAKLDGIRLIHKTDQGPIETRIYLKRILDGKAEDVKLEADDILFVPHSAGRGTMQAQPLQPIQLDIPLIWPPPLGERIFQ